MKLVVVIPYFKPDFLQCTLESLQKQSNQEYEIFLFDDASPYDPKKIIAKFKEVININYIRFDENLGSKSLAGHWNRCIEMIPEDRWVIILGDDDFLGKNCVEDFYQNLEEINQCQATVIRFSSAVIDSTGAVISKVHKHLKIESSIDFIFNKIRGHKRSSLSEHIFWMDIVKKKKFKHFPLAWHSDDLALLEFSKFDNIYSINTSVVYIRFSHVNISGKEDLSLQKNQASFQFYRYLTKYYSDHFEPDQREIILKKYEKCAINDKKNLSLFFAVSKVYITELKFYRYFQFLNSYFSETLRIIKTSSNKS